MNNFKAICDHALFLSGEFQKKHGLKIGLTVVSNENGYFSDGLWYSYVGMSAGDGYAWVNTPWYKEIGSFLVCYCKETRKYMLTYWINGKAQSKNLNMANLSLTEFETITREFVKKVTGLGF